MEKPNTIRLVKSKRKMEIAKVGVRLMEVLMRVEEEFGVNTKEMEIPNDVATPGSMLQWIIAKKGCGRLCSHEDMIWRRVQSLISEVLDVQIEHVTRETCLFGGLDEGKL